MVENRIEVNQSQKLSQGLQTAIRLLSLDMEAISEEMRKACEENPALEIVPPKKSIGEYSAMVRTGFSSSRHAEGDSDPWDYVAAEESPITKLSRQLNLFVRDSETLEAARMMLQTLEPNGYFTMGIDEFSSQTGFSKSVALAALKAVQSLEPAGCGARNLEECLRLQLEDRGIDDPVLMEIINHWLPDVARGNLRQVAKECHTTLPHAERCVEIIRSLTPSPCSLREDPVRYIIPEFSVEENESGELAIVFHNDFFPSLRRDPEFSAMAATFEGEDKAFCRGLLDSAARLISAVDLRQRTMEKLAGIIVREQRAFFLGQYSLMPLSVEDAAKEIGVSKATIYRALQNKYLYCSRGTFPLNHFFQREVSGNVSVVRTKEMIGEICRANSRISDREILQELALRGVEISRRTVAKYRSQLGIGSSFGR